MLYAVGLIITEFKGARVGYFFNLPDWQAAAGVGWRCGDGRPVPQFPLSMQLDAVVGKSFNLDFLNWEWNHSN